VFNPKEHKIKQTWDKTQAQKVELESKQNTVETVSVSRQPFSTPGLLYDATKTATPTMSMPLLTIWNTNYWWWRTYVYYSGTAPSYDTTIMFDPDNPQDVYYGVATYDSDRVDEPVQVDVVLNEKQIPYLCSSMHITPIDDEVPSFPTSPVTRFLTYGIQDSWKIYADGVLIYAGMPYDSNGWASTTQPASFYTNNGRLFEYCKYTLQWPVCVQAVGGGCDAKAILRGVFSSGVLTSVSILYGGHGYTSTPTITISNAPGTGAEAVAILTDGVVTSVTVVTGGSGYPTEAQYGKYARLWDVDVYGGECTIWFLQGANYEPYPVISVRWDADESTIPVQTVTVTRNMSDPTGIIERSVGYYYYFTSGYYTDEIAEASWNSYLTSGTHTKYINKLNSLDEARDTYRLTFHCDVTKMVPITPTPVDPNNSTAHLASLITFTDIYTIDPTVDITPPYSYVGYPYIKTTTGTRGTVTLQKHTYITPNFNITTKVALRDNQYYNEIRTSDP